MTLPAVCALCLTAAALASCNAWTGNDTELPQGKYPMTFTASVEGLTATRAITENTWTGSESVSVQVGNQVKRYTAAATGQLTATDPFYWQTTTETNKVSAWHCGDGSTELGKLHASSVPAFWEVQSDQSGGGYGQSDFLYAPATDIPFSGRVATTLHFYHQTARVVINIENAEAATSPGDIRSIAIGDAANLALSASYRQPAKGSTGTWETGSGAKGEIIPKDISYPSSYLKTYTALVIPQDMTAKRFITVSLTNGNTYHYIPNGSDANLKSGKVHTYNITVKKGYLSVETAGTGSTWGRDGADDVQVFSSSYIKPGDFYMKDGSLIDKDEVLTTEQQAACLGVVVKVGRGADEGNKATDAADSNNWTDTDEYKYKDGITPMAGIHGYVLALYDANGGQPTIWSNYYSGETGSKEVQYILFCGYSNTNTVKAYAANKGQTLKDEFPATYYATDSYE